MKFLVALSALVAIAFAAPSVPAPLAAGPIAPGLLASPALQYLGAPSLAASPLAYSAYAAAPVAYSAYAAAPVAYSAYAAPAPVAYSAVAAPAPVAYSAVAAPAPVAYSAAAAPAPVVAAHAPVAVAAPAAIKSQYHAQDELGNTAFGHSEPGQVHNSVQDAHGNRAGSFSYLNPTDGQVHRTDYVADSLGYRVAANDLPVAPAAPVADTPEVVAARAAHLALHRARRSVLLQTPASTAPLAAPVAYHAAPAIAAAPVAYHAAPAVAAAPVAYHAAPAVAAPVAYSAVPAGYPATLTTIVNNPGHAVSYRID